MVGSPPPPYQSTVTAVGEGVYTPQSRAVKLVGDWSVETIPARQAGLDQDLIYAKAKDSTARVELRFNGQKVRLTHSSGPDHGIWNVLLDGEPYIDPDTGKPLEIDAYSASYRYDVSRIIVAESAGEHVLEIVNAGKKYPASHAMMISFVSFEVLPPIRESNLLLILGMILAVEVIGLGLAALFGNPLFSNLAQRLDTKRSILLALVVYAVIAIWGFFLNSTIEFWFLAWMVAIVQGGSQALSRSLYAYLSPASKSGEFFGLFGVMEKFSAMIGPLFFAAAGAIFGSSRPAILSIITFFILGGILLASVNVTEGRQVAEAEDAAYLKANEAK